MDMKKKRYTIKVYEFPVAAKSAALQLNLEVFVNPNKLTAIFNETLQKRV